MPIKKIKSVSSSYIQKTVQIARRIPKLRSAGDLGCHSDEFTKREFVALLQLLTEIAIWEDADWDMRGVLAPIVAVSYDYNNVPVVTFPRFEPLCSEDECFGLYEDDSIAMLQEKMSLLGYTDEQIGDFIEHVTEFCDNLGIDEFTILRNLNNVGYNPIFGVRIIDYGMMEDSLEWV